MSLFMRHKKPGPLKPTANPYPSRVYQWRQKLGLITFLLLLVGGGTLRFYKPFYEIFQQRLFEGVAWTQATFIYPFQEAHWLLKESHTFMHLQEEYARLTAENEDLKWRLQALEPLVHENAVLRQDLNAFAEKKYHQLIARVLSTPYDGLHHFFLIAAGSNQGLEKDQAILASEGVVGRLEKVGTTVARVLLLTDVDSRIPVMTASSEQKAILAGDGSFLPTLVYVGDSLKIQKGEKVVTSGLGGIFPPGLSVGVVDDVTSGKIRVRPFAPFRTIEWIHVLKPQSEGFLQEVKSALGGE